MENSKEEYIKFLMMNGDNITQESKKILLYIFINFPLKKSYKVINTGTLIDLNDYPDNIIEQAYIYLSKIIVNN